MTGKYRRLRQYSAIEIAIIRKIKKELKLVKPTLLLLRALIYPIKECHEMNYINIIQ